MPWRQNKKPRSVCILIHFAASNAVMGMCLMCAGEPSVYALLATLANKRKWTTSEKEIAKSISDNKSIYDTFLLETKCWKCLIFWAGTVKKVFFLRIPSEAKKLTLFCKIIVLLKFPLTHISTFLSRWEEWLHFYLEEKSLKPPICLKSPILFQKSCGNYFTTASESRKFQQQNQTAKSANKILERSARS